MVATDLDTLLRQLFDAGALAVDGASLPWSLDHMGVIERALVMGYVRRDYGERGIQFSLTRAGYERLGEEVPVGRILKHRFLKIFHP